MPVGWLGIGHLLICLDEQKQQETELCSLTENTHMVNNRKQTVYCPPSLSKLEEGELKSPFIVLKLKNMLQFLYS